jgi:hypothetical protein
MEHGDDQWHNGYNTIKNVTSPQHKLKYPRTSMHQAQQNHSRVAIYTNFELDGVDIGADDRNLERFC